MKAEIVAEIVELEWEMFSGVNNIGGKATCQQDYKTFSIMRASQAEAWTEEVLHSYHSDLVQAKSEARNLMTEKYARMMEFTHPVEFKKIADRLPVVDLATLDLIEKIIAINLKWKVETAEKYPKLTQRGRAIYTREDSYFFTSFETYLRGELRTYSPKTIQHYYDMTFEYLNRDENLEAVYMLNMVKYYGYPSLEQAEQYA